MLVKIPSHHFEELSYILDVVFGDFLGLEYVLLRHEDLQNLDVVCQLENGNCLCVENGFFSKYLGGKPYFNKCSIPDRPIVINNKFTDFKDVPIIYGNTDLRITNSSNGLKASTTTIICGADIYASCFFMLSRWEEYVCDVRDSHLRFPLAESFAWKNNFLHRPVVNEYVEMLWRMLTHLGCCQKKKSRTFQVLPSHDVDFPFKYAFSPYSKIAKNFCRNVIKSKDKSFAFSDMVHALKAKQGDFAADPYYTFDLIMDTAERYNLKSAFYFIADHRYRPKGDKVFNMKAKN